MTSPFALPGECPRCCGEIHPLGDPTQPCDGRLVGGEICGYLSPASKQAGRSSLAGEQS